MKWIIKDEGFRKEDIEFYGSKYLLANGYMGYRGTLEEYGKEQLCACTLAGFYDKRGEGWREPVNMPDPFCVHVWTGAEELSVLKKEPVRHKQKLDMRTGRFSRETLFQTGTGICTIRSERFLSRKIWNLMAMRYRINASPGTDFDIQVTLDRDIWDINGPHLNGFNLYEDQKIHILTAKTVEQERCAAVGQMVEIENDLSIVADEDGVLHMTMPESGEICICIYGWIEKDAGEKDIQRIVHELRNAAETGYDTLYAETAECWERIWDNADIVIRGDEAMDQAVRYSMYQLISSAPFHTDETAIPARGLSGQVYKGAMFWDTELFMLPFFVSALPEVARNLVSYRIRMLEGAKRKARRLGFQGAFYAWESQDTGDEACTKYGFTDVFTGRPLRTYFGDKQIHISADVAYGIWKYYESTRDITLLLDGGLETITECIRFLYDYSVFKDRKNRYELHDVTSPDEYHERNNNDAYTNIITKEMANVMFRLWGELEKKQPETAHRMKERLFSYGEYERLHNFSEKLYIPRPDRNGVIEQCDGYFEMEDLSVEELLKRRLKDTEYLGGANGIASSTQVIKQADVVLACMLFPWNYSHEVRKANWKYYEPRTEHGSSLSACVYALGAIDSGDEEKAYRYLEKTAYTDLNGDYKLYVGNLYIGGVHTAANGGAWLVTVQGFAGVRAAQEGIRIDPSLPKQWENVSLTAHWHGQKMRLEVGHNTVNCESVKENEKEITVFVFGKKEKIKPGQKRVWNRK